MPIRRAGRNRRTAGPLTDWSSRSCGSLPITGTAARCAPRAKTNFDAYNKRGNNVIGTTNMTFIPAQLGFLASRVMIRRE
jgi:hypothetical protein